MSDIEDWALETLAVRAGQQRTNEGEHAEAIFPTSSYVFDSAAHAAARDADNPGAIAAARSAGHAAAVAHMAGHAPNAARYALKAIEAARPEAVASENAWQRSSVPEHLAAFLYPEDNL